MIKYPEDFVKYEEDDIEEELIQHILDEMEIRSKQKVKGKKEYMKDDWCIIGDKIILRNGKNYYISKIEWKNRGEKNE